MRKSKFLLLIVFVITAGLGATAIWIGYRLSQEDEVTPEESEAAGDCDSGSECNLDCEWPTTNYCACYGDEDNNPCECRSCSSQQDCNNKPYTCDWFCEGYDYCTGAESGCNPDGCPENWESCGTSVSCGGSCRGTGCTEVDENGDPFPSIECSSGGCDNKYINKRYCRPESEEQTLTCAGLTSAMGNAITLQKGDGLTQTLTGTTGGTITSDITYNFGIENSNYGTINPSTITGEDTSADTSWSITEAQSNSLQAGTYDNFIWVTMSAQGITTDRSEVCSLDLVVTEEEQQHNITVDCLSISDTTVEEGQTVTITTRSVLDTETTDSRFIEAVYMGYQPQSCSVSTQGEAGCSVFEQSFANIIAMSSHPFYGNTHEGIVRILDKNPNNITSCTQSGSLNCQIWSGDFAMNSNINKPNLSSTMTLVSIEGEDISDSGQTVYTAKWNLRIDDVTSNLVDESPLKNFILAKAEIDGNEFYSTGANPFYVYDDDCNFTLVAEEVCDCTNVTISPSDGTISPGENAVFTMNASCPVRYSEVEWETSGTPPLTLVSRNPNSDSLGTRINHVATYQVPASATSGTEYTVSATVRNQSLVQSCRKTFTVEQEDEPAYRAIKESTVECINDNSAARINYNISVENISNIDGHIEYVEDTYDSRFQTSWVGGFNPTPDSHNGNVLRWDNNDTGYDLNAGETINFRYTVTIPVAYLGTYSNGVFTPYEFENHAVVKPEDHEPINLSTIVSAQCQNYGIFDSAINKGLIGLLLIIIGAILIRFREYTYRYLLPIGNAFSFVTPVIDKSRNAVNNVSDIIKNKFEEFKDNYHESKLKGKEKFEKKTLKKFEKRRNKGKHENRRFS